MDNVLMYVSNGLIIISFISYFIILLIGSRLKISNNSGFDVTKDIISEYNSINVIESRGYFSIYNIKRKVIKLSSMCYYGFDLTSISLSIIESGISVVDRDNNKYIDLFRKFFPNLKILYLFSVLAVLINLVTYNIGDVRISLIFIVVFTVISYMLFDVKNSSINWISDNIGKISGINKFNSKKIVNFINKLLLVDKLIFLGELVIIIRFFSILL